MTTEQLKEWMQQGLRAHLDVIRSMYCILVQRVINKDVLSFPSMLKRLTQLLPSYAGFVNDAISKTYDEETTTLTEAYARLAKEPNRDTRSTGQREMNKNIEAAASLVRYAKPVETEPANTQKMLSIVSR